MLGLEINVPRWVVAINSLNLHCVCVLHEWGCITQRWCKAPVSVHFLPQHQLPALLGTDLTVSASHGDICELTIIWRSTTAFTRVHARKKINSKPPRTWDNVRCHCKCVSVVTNPKEHVLWCFCEVSVQYLALYWTWYGAQDVGFANRREKGICISLHFAYLYIYRQCND